MAIRRLLFSAVIAVLSGAATAQTYEFEGGCFRIYGPEALRSTEAGNPGTSKRSSKLHWLSSNFCFWPEAGIPSAVRKVCLHRLAHMAEQSFEVAL